MKDVLVQSGDYRHGFCYCEVPDLRSTYSTPELKYDPIVKGGLGVVRNCSLMYSSCLVGEYTIVVSTFEAGLLGQFFLTVGCNTKFTIMPIPLEGAVCTQLILT